MPTVDEVLKNREALMLLLQKVSTADLADALAVRKEIIALNQTGVQVLMIPRSRPSTT